jgi:hypothetical protein
MYGSAFKPFWRSIVIYYVKQLFSILTVLLVVTAMLHFSVARHYCGGELVASRISLSGALATCGMEDTGAACPYDHDGDRIESHCCDDVLTSYSIDNNYTPATKAAAGLSQGKIPAPVMLLESPVRSSFIIHKTWSDISPPGQLMTSSVDLTHIRVFRI